MMCLSSWRMIPVVAALASFVALGLASAEDEPDVQMMIMHAKTAADHGVLAAYYEKEAAAARLRSENHEKMAKYYVGGPVLGKDQFAKHCNELAKLARAEMEQYETLARLHREVAEPKK